jgi:hypothetical protein
MTPGPHTPARYGFATDTWAVGIVTYELLTGLPPYASECRSQVRPQPPAYPPQPPPPRGSKHSHFCAAHQSPEPSPGPRPRPCPTTPAPSRPQAELRICSSAPPAFPAYVSLAARDFVLRLLAPLPADRPTVRQLLSHPWLAAAPESFAPQPCPSAASSLSRPPAGFAVTSSGLSHSLHQLHAQAHPHLHPQQQHFHAPLPYLTHYGVPHAHAASASASLAASTAAAAEPSLSASWPSVSMGMGMAVDTPPHASLYTPYLHAAAAAAEAAGGGEATAVCHVMSASALSGHASGPHAAAPPRLSPSLSAPLPLPHEPPPALPTPGKGHDAAPLAPCVTLPYAATAAPQPGSHEALSAQPTLLALSRLPVARIQAMITKLQAAMELALAQQAAATAAGSSAAGASADVAMEDAMAADDGARAGGSQGGSQACASGGHAGSVAHSSAPTPRTPPEPQPSLSAACGGGAAATREGSPRSVPALPPPAPGVCFPLADAASLAPCLLSYASPLPLAHLPAAAESGASAATGADPVALGGVTAALLELAQLQARAAAAGGGAGEAHAARAPSAAACALAELQALLSASCAHAAQPMALAEEEGGHEPQPSRSSGGGGPHGVVYVSIGSSRKATPTPPLPLPLRVGDQAVRAGPALACEGDMGCLGGAATWLGHMTGM